MRLNYTHVINRLRLRINVMIAYLRGRGRAACLYILPRNSRSTRKIAKNIYTYAMLSIRLINTESQSEMGA